MTARHFPNRYRVFGWVLTGTGIVVVLLGAVGLVIAATLPWATLTVLNTSISVPGVVLGMGAITAGLGVVTISQFGFVRRFAWLGMAIGVLTAYLGIRATDETGKGVVKLLLSIQRRLAPVNARLAEVSLPPIEPVGASIKARRDYVGVGPLYTTWAGMAVASGSVFLLVGERLRRTCARCRHVWSAKRGDTIPFCPHCGTRTRTDAICSHCATAILPGELFCPSCGTGTSPTSLSV